MSNALRFDSLLVRDLAAELHQQLAGRPAGALFFDHERRIVRLDLRGAVLLWNLHPARGGVALVEVESSADADEPTHTAPDVEQGTSDAPGAVRLARGARLVQVSSPADERVIGFRLRGGGATRGRARRLVIELVANQWNALAVDATGAIVSALVSRSTAGRQLRAGANYRLPEPTRRAGASEPIDLDAWIAILSGVAPDERTRTLVSRVAYASPLNAVPILGAAGQVRPEGPPSEDGSDSATVPPAASPDAGLAAAYRRYRDVVWGPRSPCVLVGDVEGPYPVPLPGVPSEPAASLLSAIESAGATPPAAAPGVPPALLGRLEGRLRQLARRADRLAEELAGARPEAEELRRRADLLLSHLHLARKGLERIDLPDLEGGTLAVELDPALEPAENARRLYDAARKRERAADRLPELLSEARSAYDRLAALRDRAESGAAAAAEVEAALGPARRTGTGPDAPLLPYRRYRTSGGNEVRVGRGSRHNDQLTFQHSAPEDIWLHARDAAGAHVILRWPDRVSNPPARELYEAAVLAALHSRLRTSGTVPVDWTRRKYVRKPRKAPPGLVTPDRVRTLFVEPDPALEKRLRP